MPFWNGILFQDPNSKVMSMISNMHDYYMIMLSIITILIMGMMMFIMLNKKTNLSFFSHENMENMWIIMPFIILCVIIYPTMNLLFLNDNYNNPDLTVKIMGHQWYWSYEYTNFNIEPYDSYMINDSNLSTNDFRLLEVDNRLILPYGMTSQLLVSSSDVIHSWTIPSLGLKIDAIPGRLNQMSITPIIMGLLYGQCSEICGVNHSFMPITIEIISPKKFLNWIIKQ